MTTTGQKKKLMQFFDHWQGRICDVLESLEEDASHLEQPVGRFQKKVWKRYSNQTAGQDGGGGTMATLKGRVFEKAGVNISTVYGKFTPEFAKNISGADKDPRFWASGISLVLHPLNPFVPAVHLNTRHIVTTRSWFGGGSDLTPTFEFPEDTLNFHNAFKRACDAHNPDFHARFKSWCDDYFYLPHRQEARGIGGIFYDNLEVGAAFPNFDNGFAFTEDVLKAFINIYPALVQRHIVKPWTQDDKQKQLIKRGRYVEFNLLYDRGTHFGLKTDGNIEAILMSMPPLAGWL